MEKVQHPIQISQMLFLFVPTLILHFSFHFLFFFSLVKKKKATTKQNKTVLLEEVLTRIIHHPVKSSKIFPSLIVHQRYCCQNSFARLFIPSSHLFPHSHALSYNRKKKRKEKSSSIYAKWNNSNQKLSTFHTSLIVFSSTLTLLYKHTHIRICVWK